MMGPIVAIVDDEAVADALAGLLAADAPGVALTLDRKLAAIRAHRTQPADGHLLRALPDDLARFLAREPWRLAARTAARG